MENEIDELLDDMEKLFDGGDVDMSDSIKTKNKKDKRMDYLKSIDRMEFEEGGLYYFKTEGEPSQARNENCFQSIFFCVCPQISILQFIVLISLFEILIFIISCSIYGIKNDAFLSPNPHALDLLGWQDNKKIKNKWEVWRWVTPIFLHGHFEHLLGNVVAQLILGSGIEYGIGVVKMIILYILTGIGGNLLSAILSPAQFGVGASTSVFGLVGFLIAYIFTNFFDMGRKRCFQRWYLIIITSVLVIMNLNQGPGADQKVDNWGHLGGLITGIFTGLAITETFDIQAEKSDRIPDRFTEEEYKNRCCLCKTFLWNVCGIILLFLWFFILLVIFYGYIDTENMDQGSIDDDGH